MIGSQWIKDGSRFAPVESVLEADGSLVMAEEEPLLYEELEAVERHLVCDGDTLFALGQRYYGTLMERACGLYWAIADFNGMSDVTQPLRSGAVLLIPPFEYVLQHLSSVQGAFV